MKSLWRLFKVFLSTALLITGVFLVELAVMLVSDKKKTYVLAYEGEGVGKSEIGRAN